MESKKRKGSVKKDKNARPWKKRKFSKEDAIQHKKVMDSQYWKEMGESFCIALNKCQDFPPWENGIFLQRQPMSVSGTLYSGRNAMRLLFSMIELGHQLPLFGTTKAWFSLNSQLGFKNVIKVENLDRPIMVYSKLGQEVKSDEKKAENEHEFVRRGKYFKVYNIACTSLMKPENKDNLEKVMEAMKTKYKSVKEKQDSETKKLQQKLSSFEIAMGWGKSQDQKVCDEKEIEFTGDQALKYYNSFTHTDKIPRPALNFDDIKDSISKWHTSNTAPYYSITKDKIVMPPVKSFTDAQSFAAVLFHELAHATGHHSRLGRFSKSGENNPILTTLEKKDLYAVEEMVAEICTSFLCKHAGILTPRCLGFCGAYVKFWSKDQNLSVDLIQAVVSHAIKAFYYIVK